MDRSITAYDVPQRVASYDANMDLMHPNRSIMVRVALEVLPLSREARLMTLDLGSGTGYFTAHFLAQFPNSRVIALDGATAMVEVAQARLGPDASKVDFRVGDFRDLQGLGLTPGSLDAVFSSYALHHLNRADKQAVVRQVAELLRPGGWFVNADLVIADAPDVEHRIQQLRVEGIVRRAARRDDRFPDVATTRRLLDELEANEGDQPLTLAEDLHVLRSAGLRDVCAFWLEYRELVSGGHR